MEYGPGTIDAGFPSYPAFGVGGQSYSNFLAFTVVTHCISRISEVYDTAAVTGISDHNVGNH